MKYGFIYLWYDRKHKKYYLGRHWGTEHDGYICSSVNMRNNYTNRSQDFKRRIISRVYTSVEDLIVEEQRWLDMINPNECKVRYYNVSLNSTSPTMRGRKHSEETKNKMSIASKGKPKSESHKEKLRIVNLGKKYSDETNRKKARPIGYKHTEETKQKMRGRIVTDEFRKKMSILRRSRINRNIIGV